MAKHGRTLPARRSRSAREDALLIRSAESLGRMIGSLQRELDGVTKKVSGTGVMKIIGRDGSDGNTARGGDKSSATKVRATTDRTSKRAAKSASAKKTAGRSRSGASRTPPKSKRRA